MTAPADVGLTCSLHQEPSSVACTRCGELFCPRCHHFLINGRPWCPHCAQPHLPNEAMGTAALLGKVAVIALVGALPLFLLPNMLPKLAGSFVVTYAVVWFLFMREKSSMHIEAVKDGHREVILEP